MPYCAVYIIVLWSLVLVSGNKLMWFYQADWNDQCKSEGLNTYLNTMQSMKNPNHTKDIKRTLLKCSFLIFLNSKTSSRNAVQKITVRAAFWHCFAWQKEIQWNKQDLYTCEQTKFSSELFICCDCSRKYYLTIFCSLSWYDFDRREMTFIQYLTHLRKFCKVLNRKISIALSNQSCLCE